MPTLARVKGSTIQNVLGMRESDKSRKPMAEGCPNAFWSTLWVDPDQQYRTPAHKTSPPKQSPSEISLSLYDPLFSFNDVRRLFGDPFAGFLGLNQQIVHRDTSDHTLTRGFTPRVDIHENPERNRAAATFELPGLTKDDIKIDIQNGRLIISDEQTLSKDVEEKGFVHRERNYGRFSRAVPVPSATKPEEIQAKLENGLLTVTYPKASAEQQAQRVPIT